MADSCVFNYTGYEILQHRIRPPGADRRYMYVPYKELTSDDQTAVVRIYVNTTAHIPYNEYFYPVDKTGRLVSAKRWISNKRGQELYDLYQIQKVMDQ